MPEIYKMASHLPASYEYEFDGLHVVQYSAVSSGEDAQTIAATDIFALISAEDLKEIKESNAIFVFNFTFEGSFEHWPWSLALHTSAVRHQVSFDKIYYICGDFSEHIQYSKLYRTGINIVPVLAFPPEIKNNIPQEYNRQDYLDNWQGEYFFTFLCRRNKSHRVKMMYDILNNENLRPRALLSLNTENPETIFPVKAPESWVHKWNDEKDYFTNCFLFFENNGKTILPGTETPPNIHNSLLLDLTGQVLFDVVAETYQEGSHIFYSEKTFRPMGLGMPFLLWGVPFASRKLKRFGFKLYENLFDYSFDNEEDTDNRYQLLITELKRVCNVLESMTHEERKKWHLQDKDAIDHNQNLIMECNQFNGPAWEKFRNQFKTH